MTTGVPEFHREFEAETGALLRRRFWWFLASLGTMYVFFRSLSLVAFGILSAGAAALSSPSGIAEKALSSVRFGRAGVAAIAALSVLDVGVMLWAAARVMKLRPPPASLERLTVGVLMAVGASHIVAMVLINELGFPWVITVYHLLACAFLPWGPVRAFRAVMPLVALNACALFLFGKGGETAWKVFIVTMSLFAGAPGVLIAMVRQSRRMEAFRVKMLATRYGQIRRELYDAQRIHEALFPRPVQAGPLRFDFRYQPMLQIGGDYLYARFSPARESAGSGPPAQGAFNLLLMDVTGHGIAAALTVNRLYGEVERLFAEDPHASPGDVLAALNRYVHLTLANHSVYVTALCVRIDHASDTLEYASGGHPPAFVCRAGGGVERLDSTAFVLGACAAEDFDPGVTAVRFGPGDRLVAYTDGALECRNHQGKMLGLAGLARVMEELHGGRAAGDGAGLCGAVLSRVEQHRAGPPEDDTLVVEVTRAVGVGAAKERVAAYA